jgi:hypothetical protein
MERNQARQELLRRTAAGAAVLDAPCGCLDKPDAIGVQFRFSCEDMVVLELLALSGTNAADASCSQVNRV